MGYNTDVHIARLRAIDDELVSLRYGGEHDILHYVRREIRKLKDKQTLEKSTIMRK